MTKTRKAWIERSGSRFLVVWEGVLFPGYQSRSSKTFSRRGGAVDLIHREGGTLQQGDCPLPRITEAMSKAYFDGGKPADDRALQRAANETSGIVWLKVADYAPPAEEFKDGVAKLENVLLWNASCDIVIGSVIKFWDGEIITVVAGHHGFTFSHYAIPNYPEV